MKSTPPLPIDQLIDLAAREMTETAAVDLTARVVERLQPRRPASLVPHLAAAGTLAAAATLTLALWWPRALPPAAPAAPVTSVAASSGGSGTAAEPAVARRPTRGARQAPRISPEEAAWLTRRIPALEPAAPIAISSIQPSRPSIAPITMEPIGPKAIDLPPIDVRTTGGR